jgi:hypothetical protein
LCVIVPPPSSLTYSSVDALPITRSRGMPYEGSKDAAQERAYVRVVASVVLGDHLPSQA